MKDSLLFIWSRKEDLKFYIKHFQGLNFKYVESIAWGILDKSKLKNYQSQMDNDKESELININSIFTRQSSTYFSCSHMNLLVFRYSYNSSRKLELRHQRNTDAVISSIIGNDFALCKPKKYIYDLIETLLPRKNNSMLRLIELISSELLENSDSIRDEWLKLTINS